MTDEFQQPVKLGAHEQKLAQPVQPAEPIPPAPIAEEPAKPLTKRKGR